ncbi:hypothetical protein [Aquidulcibacter sp.]|uniref:hypothetical protein n=1 Tax=Aquidulcibacter sp. TaxID=2052990 RepID=UPI0025C1AC5A|nr:hypothetical protein [Aquidulcibacter sp.]MCA3691766.1 hypothetical protein [Aquidulcibacter sp.]
MFNNSDWWGASASPYTHTAQLNELPLWNNLVEPSVQLPVRQTTEHAQFYFVRPSAIFFANRQYNEFERTLWESGRDDLLRSLFADFQDIEEFKELDLGTKTIVINFVQSLPILSALPKYSFAGDGIIDFFWGEVGNRHLIVGLSEKSQYIITRSDGKWQHEDILDGSATSIASKVRALILG